MFSWYTLLAPHANDLRCNGEHPRCSSCIGLGVVCQYEPTNSASNVLVRKEYLSDLEDRVAANERKIQQVDQLLRSHLSRQTNGQQDALPSIPGENSYHAEDLEEPRDEDAATNGMAMTFLEEHTSAFFGESSNLSFTRFLFRSTAAISQPLSTAQASLDTFPVDKSRPRPTPGSPTQPNDVITTLPSAEAMEKMLNLYFDHPGLVFPFVHESTMRQQYADFKANGFSRARRTWLGLLNMIFALASRFDVSSDLMPGLNQSEVSDTFHKRAKSLCGRLSTRVVSLEIIQYLILEVIHCQGMQRSTQAWNIFGLLVRSAIALGLHGTHKRLDLITAESYRRTWLVIYGLDRLLSMVFGRPMAIVDEQMAILSPIESSIGEPADIMDLAGCFLTASSHLYQIMGMSLVKQYGANVDHARNDVDELALLQASEEVRQALRTWMAKLPACLGICHSQSEMLLESTKANRLRVILTLRYHNLNLLIHRPLLSASLRHLSKQDVPGYTLQLARAGASACVQSAVATIDVVHSIVNADPTSRSNLGIWFFTLYYGL